MKHLHHPSGVNRSPLCADGVRTDSTSKRTQYERATMILLCVALISFHQSLSAQPSAFPGAEGFGRYATGGRGGRVIEVTSLDDNGPGTLRAAITATGPRMIVFRVSGTIKLRSMLRIRSGNVTIAGQTAPGDGICVRDYTVRVEASNVIIRYLRFRLGDSTKLADDALDGWGSVGSMYRNIIIDHCSISWALDENGSFYDMASFTLQWCFLTESLYNSYHPKGLHGYGGIWGGWRASFHHNLFAHNSSRNPRFNGSRYTLMPDSELVDYRNNVIYNWGFNSAYGGEAGNQNMVANYYKYGPGTRSSVRSRIVSPDDTLGNWYIAENYVYGDPVVTADNWNGGVQGGWAPVQKNRRMLTPFPVEPLEPQTAEEAYEHVLTYGGASLPRRDTIDARIANEVQTGTSTYGGLWGAGLGIIDTQDSVGGWPVLSSLPPPVDSDHDGMPDDWELAKGLNPADISDGALIAADGYSNLEHYLNSLVSQFPTSVVEQPARPSRSAALLYNYPNPFNPQTTIEYVIPRRGRVTIEVFSMLGLRVGIILDAVQESGTHHLTFDGSALSSGVYFCRLTTGSSMYIRRMVLLR